MQKEEMWNRKYLSSQINVIKQQNNESEMKKLGHRRQHNTELL